MDLAIDQPNGWLDQVCANIRNHLDKSFLSGDRMSDLNQQLASLEMKLNGKSEDEVQESEIASYLGQILACLDKTLAAPFKQWMTNRNNRLRNPTRRGLEEFDRPEVGRQDEPGKPLDQEMSSVSVGGGDEKKDSSSGQNKDQKVKVRTEAERMASTLKRYKEFKKGRDQKTRKKMKMTQSSSGDSDSSDDEVDVTRTSAAQRGDLQLQKKKVKEVGSALKKWNKLKDQMNNSQNNGQK